MQGSPPLGEQVGWVPIPVHLRCCGGCRGDSVDVEAAPVSEGLQQFRLADRERATGVFTCRRLHLDVDALAILVDAFDVLGRKRVVL